MSDPFARQSLVRASDIELKRTCYACPEQYDAFLGGRQVGYLRLRHGYFSVDVPDAGGDTIYDADIGPVGGDIGIFTEEEREPQLWAARQNIADWLNRR